MRKLRLIALSLGVACLVSLSIGASRASADPLGNSATGTGTATCGGTTYTFLIPGHANPHAAVHITGGSSANILIATSLTVFTPFGTIGYTTNGQQTGLQGSISTNCTGMVTFSTPSGPLTFPFVANLFTAPH
jgi:hypothetical protein